MPGAGRKPLETPTERHVIRLTAAQWEEFVRLDGSLWLQGQMNLKIKERQSAEKNKEQDRFRAESLAASRAGVPLVKP